MCGICGIVTFQAPLATEAEARVGQMLSALAHRGPDRLGIRAGPAAVLGATRLAIRAPEAGEQPMVGQAGMVAVCNGEIDNHQDLRLLAAARGVNIPKGGDVEVILPLYLKFGEEFVSMLAGAFALALWDPTRRQLLLARDRAGERPLFFARDSEAVVFATEIAALANDPGLTLHFDRRQVSTYLWRGWFPAPDTPFAEVAKVGPGEMLVIGPAGVRRKRYWRWGITGPLKRPAAESVFDPILRRAVSRQTDVDVDFGVFLSGGLDSSLIAAIARDVRADVPLPAYTLRFDDVSYDEGRFAQRVADLLGMDCSFVRIRPDDFPREIRSLVSLVGEPLADPAWVPTSILARRARQDVKMVLVGEGGDELFGGYPTYPGTRLADWFSALPHPVRAVLSRAVQALPVSDRKIALSYLVKKLVAADGLEQFERHLFWTASTPPDQLRRLGLQIPAVPDPPDSAGDLLDRLQLWDLEMSLAEGLLAKADRAGMGSALEYRAPFLDLDVLEFAATLARTDRVAGLRTKVFLKRFARRYLPREIVQRRKRGLSVPLNAWLRGPLFDWAAGRLSSDLLVDVGIAPGSARALLEEHRRRLSDHARPLWALLVLAEWLQWAVAQPSVRLASD